MTQEDKELLLKDLSARLPYRTKVKCPLDDEPYTVLSINWNKEIVVIGFMMDEMYVTSKQKLVNIKPYLRPLSSMIQEEMEFLNKMALENSLKCIEEEDPQKVFLLRIKHDAEELAYLYEHHYDVNGLIPSGHAIEVTEDNNPYKN